jgi:nitrite reductase (NO-forming)
MEKGLAGFLYVTGDPSPDVFHTASTPDAPSGH